MPATKTDKSIGKFLRQAAKSHTEEEVITAYQRLLSAEEWQRPYGSDGVYGDTLFEFKYDQDFTAIPARRALAQACYYLRRFWNGTNHLPVPLRVAVCDKNEAFVVAADALFPFFNGNTYDWQRPPSSPDPQLVEALAAVPFNVIGVTSDAGVQQFVGALETAGTRLRKVITRRNFISVFLVWKSTFAEDLSAQDAATAFLYDIQKMRSVNEDAGWVRLGPHNRTIELRGPVIQHRTFWEIYDIPPTARELKAVLARKDQLVAIQTRREQGEFFTRLDVAAIAHAHILAADPDAYDRCWWDCCCGTGNLTYECPEMPERLFLSTLNAGDLELLEQSGQNHEAVKFQYDFLNAKRKELPRALRTALKSKPMTFILNPPFAAGTGGFSVPDGEESRSGVATTGMHNRIQEAVGYATRNTLAQFLFRVAKVTDENPDVLVGTFSKAIWVTGPNYKLFRDWWFDRFQFVSGFCVPSTEFQGATGKWPVVFTLWKRGKESARSFRLDVMERDKGGDFVKTGGKAFGESAAPLNKWVKRPKGAVVRPPFTTALTAYNKGFRVVDTLTADAIGYINLKCNDVQNSNRGTFILSAPAGARGCGGWSITPENFLDSMTVFAARKLVKATWLNDRDEFSVPNVNHPDYAQFQLDAVIWALFHGSNQTSSLANIEYKGNIYDIPNEFFWIAPYEMRDWPRLSMPLHTACSKAKPRFVARWLAGKEFSADALAVLLAGTELAKASVGYRKDAARKYQLDRWDAGWYQLRMGLYGKDVAFARPPALDERMAAFKAAYKALGDRLRPLVYGLGMLPREETLADG